MISQGPSGGHDNPQVADVFREMVVSCSYLIFLEGQGSRDAPLLGVGCLMFSLSFQCLMPFLRSFHEARCFMAHAPRNSLTSQEKIRAWRHKFDQVALNIADSNQCMTHVNALNLSIPTKAEIYNGLQPGFMNNSGKLGLHRILGFFSMSMK